MKRRFLSAGLCLALLVSAVLPLSGCGDPAAHSANLTAGVRVELPGGEASLTGETRTAAADFAVKLFQAGAGADGALLSPVSVLCALAMAANGAGGETLAQMEAVFGADLGALNDYLSAYRGALPSDKACRVSLANSVWLRDDPELTVERAFLEAAAGYYGADLYTSAFDPATVQDVNRWISDKTGGLIPSILDRIPEDAMVYLVNALHFDGEWEAVYRESAVQSGRFTAEDGQLQTVDFLYSKESRYLEDRYATGFLKPYAGGKYAFAALLPKEGISLADYVAFLTGEGLLETLEGAQDAAVDAAVPKFHAEHSAELSETLKALGMTDAFSPSADFSALGRYEDWGLCLSRVLHKTSFDLDERGTRAGAATVVEASSGSAAPVDVKTVYLDRPFVYLLLDTETYLPLFLGTLTSAA